MVPWQKSFMQIPIDIRYHIFQPVKSSYSRSFRIIMSSQIIKLSFDEKNPIKTVRNLQVDFSRQIRQGWQLDIYIYEKLQSIQEENLFKNRSWWSTEPNIFRMLYIWWAKKTSSPWNLDMAGYYWKCLPMEQEAYIIITFLWKTAPWEYWFLGC